MTFKSLGALEPPLIIQSVIITGKGQFYITKIGTDQTDCEIGTLE